MPQSADMRAVGEFVASRYSTFTLQQAITNNVSRKVIRRLERDGTVVRLRQATWRFANVEPTWRHDLYAATVGLRAVGSFYSAGALHLCDGLLDPPSIPDISCHHFAPVDVPNAVIHRSTSMPNADITEIDGIRCTSLARTVIDLAPLLTPLQLTRLIDDVQRRKQPSMDDLMKRASLLVSRGRSGPQQVMDIVRRRLGGYVVPESWFERLLSEALRSSVLNGVVRQHELRDDHGQFIARFDLAVPWARLGIEGHSRSFHLGEIVERYDEGRDIRITKQGWQAVYLGFSATRSPRAVCRDIEQIVLRRATDLGLNPYAA